MRFTTFLILFASCFGNLNAQIVTIPDANFKIALLSHSPVIDSNSDSEIQVSEAAAFSGTMNVSSRSIADLTGIEAFTNLQKLNCSNNQLTSLILNAKTSLTELTCYSNKLTSLDLTDYTALTYLSCYRNLLASIDPTTNTALTYLNCNINQILALDVSANFALTYLDCSTNKLTSLNVTVNTALNTLYCGFNPIFTLDVHNNTALRILGCQYNQLTSLDVSANTNLFSLQCYSNQLTSLDLTANIALSNLRSDNNPLGALDLSANTALTNLSCDNNQLTSLDLSTNLLLTWFTCTSNQLTSLDVKANTALQYLWCERNGLTSIDLTATIGLISFFCSDNKLTSLDLTHNVVLTDLKCYGNQLVLLDIRNNVALENLVCYGNKLTALDVKTNVALRLLNCQFNQITSLDLKTNGALTDFRCHSNRLNFLDLRNGKNNLILNNTCHFSSNPDLTCISVDNPSWSTSNWTNIDTQTVFSNNCACGVFSVDYADIIDVVCGKPGKIRIDISGADGPFEYDWLGQIGQTDSIIEPDSLGIYVLKVTNALGCESELRYIMKAPKSISDFELNTNLSAGVFRPGRLTCLNLSAWNDGCKERSGLITVTYHGPVIFDSASIPPNSHVTNKNELKWSFSQMKYEDEAFLSKVCFQVEPSARAGDRICFDVEITPRADDFDSTNNDKSYCYDVVNSYDPNDKQVYPQGVCAENYVLKDQPLTYTIRFQNTGNASAIDVFLIDSLSTYLDIKTLRVLTTSHKPLVTEVLENNTVKFGFNNINLADSTSDPGASQGFVVYEIRPFPGLNDGAVIQNKAGIYFDFNPPVITNTTMNTLTSSLPSSQITNIQDSLFPTYNYNGFIYRETGNYQHYYYDQFGCDSVVDLTLFQGSVSKSVDNQNACESYTWIDGNTYTASTSTPTHRLLGASFNGNDSIVSLNLTINHPNTGTDTQTACGSYTWIDGNTYAANNNSATHTLVNSEGCDSVVSLNLTIISPSTGTDTQTACESFIWIDGLTYFSSNNSATFTLQNAQGCDSIVSLNLTINKNAESSDIHFTCAPSYTWIDGITYFANNNTATYALTTTSGCDSIITLDLTVSASASSGKDIKSACNSITWIDGNTYSASNNSATYTIVNGSVLGCDSIVVLDFTYTPNTGIDHITTCGSTYIWIDEISYTENNNTATYLLEGGSANGCDSLVQLDLTLVADIESTLTNNSPNLTANINNATYQWLDCGNAMSIIPGESGQTFTATVSGDYAVIITNGICSDTSACEAVQITGAVMELQHEKISIYPNPTQGTIQINLGEAHVSTTITILDLQGRVLKELDASGLKNISIDFQEAAGTYLLQVSRESRIVATERLIKN